MDVNIEYFADPAEVVTKLRAGGAGVDILLDGSYHVELSYATSVLAPLDVRNIPNWGHGAVDPLIKQKPMVRTYWDRLGDLTQQLATGEVVVAWAWEPAFEPRRDDIDVRWAFPKQGQLGWYNACYTSKPLDRPHVELVETWRRPGTLVLRHPRPSTGPGRGRYEFLHRLAGMSAIKLEMP